MSAPLGDAQHVCFICLQTNDDEPNGPWVNPCPCSLEAHQNCMLQWIAESEYEAARRVGTPRSPLKCPACKARIRLEEPHDKVVAAYNRFLRGYSRVSPLFLLSLVSGGAVIGSAWYGMTAFSIFAGPRTAIRWLGVRPLINGRRDMSGWQAALSSLVKLTELSLIGPTLISMWAVPASVVLSMPASIMFAATLISQDHVPSWPPSPQWALIGLPYVHMGYEIFYNRLFASFERRLNRALRGRPPTDDAVEAAGAPGQAAPAANPADEDRRNNNAGAWAILTALGAIVTAIFQDPPQRNANIADGEAPPEGGIQIEIDLGGMAAAEEEADGEADPAGEAAALFDNADFQFVNPPFHLPPVAANEPGLADDLGALEDPLAQVPEAVPEQAVELGARLEDPVAQFPRQLPAAARAPRRHRHRPRRNPAPAAGNDEDRDAAEPRISVFAVIANGIATTLLLPVISYAAGELIRAVMPSAWTRRAVSTGAFRRRSLMPATGLLQMRWGRSLAGACLYYVLRDAFSLFYKYRKVQVKSSRRVKNVERKPGEEHTAAPGTRAA
ncbi:hypothetical protein QBC39DRAFT_79972 [Podospora conica]|nr:hypothetical protein QBC39DRAFT_79972 [Schizothecium conicum]